MNEKYLRDTDLAARFNVSRNTIWRWKRESPEFPRPVYLSPGSARWKLSEVEAWEATQSASRANAGPCAEGAA